MSDLHNFIGRSAKYIVVGIAVLVIVGYQSSLPVYYVCGGVCNSVFSKVIKSLVKQPRPMESKKSGYGMPSSHSQSIFYFVSILCIKIYNLQWETLTGYLCIICLLFYSYTAVAYRISSKLHTTNQTIVGAILGVIIGAFAVRLENIYKFTLYDLTGYTDRTFPLILRLALCIIGILILVVDSQQKKKLF